MILNIIVLIFIGSMIWMWAQQGLFSSFIQMILTIIAGCVAFMLWEPVVYGMLLNTLTESAWGVGLLGTFGGTLLLLRIGVDKFVPGNLNFHNIIDSVGGAVFGYVSGVLTAGILLLGAQMIGLPSIGYQGWWINDKTGVVEMNASSRLWHPADKIASEFFVRLSGGSMSPIFSRATLESHHPMLWREASLFHQSMNWKAGGHSSSMRTLSPSNIKLIPDTGFMILTELPSFLEHLSEQLKMQPGDKLVIVGTDVVGNNSESGTTAGDAGGTFRIAPTQIALVARVGSEHQYFTPRAYIQGGQSAPLRVNDFAYSGTSGGDKFHWLFVLPSESQVPLYITLKQTRLELADKPTTDADRVEDLLVVGGTGPGTTLGTVSVKPDVNAGFGLTLNKSKLDPIAVKLADTTNALIEGEFDYTPKDDIGLSASLSVSTIYADANARVVKIPLGTKQDRASVINKLNSLNATDPPKLVTSDGKEYLCIGYVRKEGNKYHFKIDPTKKMQNLNDLSLGSVANTGTVTLFFHVDKGKTIQRLQVGDVVINDKDLNKEVPRGN